MFSTSLFARALTGLGIVACSACVGETSKPDTLGPQAFYTVTAEIALVRHDARLAALEYATAAKLDSDVGLLRRATEVTVECLQPSLTIDVVNWWIKLDPAAMDAHRAAAKAALDLYNIEQSAGHYRAVIELSPRGKTVEFAAVEAELGAADNLYAARQVADQLALFFPAFVPALHLQGFAALRADDPAAAVRSFQAALVAADSSEPLETERQSLKMGLRQARILAGDANEPLTEAKELVDGAPTAATRLDYALLLLAAQQYPGARAQLTMLTSEADSAPGALRLLGLLDFQQGNLEDSGRRFAELAATGQFSGDALYYLGLIAERHDDFERALRLYAQIQDREKIVSAMLRAAALLIAHGAAAAADELLDRLLVDEPRRAPEILAARARIYADAGDIQRAVAVLEAAVLQYPDAVELRYATASMAEEQGRLAAALRVLKDVAALRPMDPAALNAYGYTLADNNRHLAAARSLIERAHAAAPRNAAILDSLGWVLFRQGRGEDALTYLTSAFAEDRGGEIAAHLGEVLWHLGRRSDAERIWSEASRTGPENPLLAATRRRLREPR